MNHLALVGAVRGIQEKLPAWAQNVIVGFVFAAFAVLTLPSPMNHFETLDPVIYQSYIHDYEYMIDIYGYTYYAIRVAWIVPAYLMQLLFGDSAGYLIVRILLLGGAASAFAILVERLFRRPYGIYAAAWMAFSPALLREMAQDYGDGAAFCYAFIGLAFLLTRKEKGLLEHFFGGVFLGLAFNTYPTAAAVPIMAIPAWLYVRRKVDLKSNVLCAASAAAGFVAMYFLIAVYLWSVFSRAGYSFEIIPLSTMKSLAEGGAAVWQSSLEQIFLTNGDWSRAYPLFVFAALVLFLAFRRRAPQDASPEVVEAAAAEREGLIVATILCGMALALYLGLHFILHSGAISLPWTYHFVLPVCGLGSIGLVCAVTPRRFDRWAVALGAAILIVPYLVGVSNEGLPRISPNVWLVIGLVISIAILLVRVFRTRPLAPAAILAAALMAFPLAFYYSSGIGSCGYPGQVIKGLWLPAAPSYAGCMFRAKALPFERDLRTGILALMDDLKKTDPGEAPGIWYANKSGFADQVGSAYLWQYSRIASLEADDPGMPRIDSFAKSQIDKFDTLVLVAASRDQIKAAEQALKAGGYTVTPQVSRRVGGHTFSFDYTILKKAPYDPAKYAVGPSIDLASVTAENGAINTVQADGLHIQTPPAQWSYAAFVPLGKIVNADTAFVELDLTVKEGSIGTAALQQTSSPGFIGAEMLLYSRNGRQKVYVPVSLAAGANVLVLRNIDIHQSAMVLHGIRLVQKKP